jgi:hypothetical protein
VSIFSKLDSWYSILRTLQAVVLSVVYTWLFRFIDSIQDEGHQDKTKLIASLGFALTLATWLVLLAYPSLVTQMNGPLSELLEILTLVPPFAAILAISYILWPKIANSDLSISGPMSGYLRLIKYDLRRRAFLSALALSLINGICLLIVARHR